MNRALIFGLVAALALATGTAAAAQAAPKGPKCAGYSCAGQPSRTTSRPRTVPVRPYVTKKGTYVQGTYRSRPTKK